MSVGVWSDRVVPFYESGHEFRTPDGALGRSLAGVVEWLGSSPSRVYDLTHRHYPCVRKFPLAPALSGNPASHMSDVLQVQGTDETLYS